MTESGRYTTVDVPVEVDNTEALIAKVNVALDTLHRKNQQIIALKAQIKILKEVIWERGD